MVMAPNRAAEHAVSEQHVRLAQMLGQAKGRVSERIMYYRKPNRGSEAGWIVTAGTNPERQIGLYAKGFVPMDRYGFVNPQDVYVPESVNPDQEHAYRVWSKMLTTPGGPDEFPVDQLIQLRWYDPNICPVPGTRFEQLAGAALTKFWCPECESIYFHRAVHLARHLRASHEWDRSEIAAYGQEAGISFTKEAAGDRNTVEMLTYEMPDAPEPVAPLPQMEIDEYRPPQRGPGRPRKESI